jgi:hypothetical protein
MRVDRPAAKDRAERFARSRRGASLAALLSALMGCSESNSALTIELVDPIVLSSPDSTIDLLARSPAVSRRGDFIAYAAPWNKSAALLFDARGRYVKTVGRPGRGPGEISSLDAAGFGAGDSIWILDTFVAAHVFSPAPIATYVRSVHLEQRTPGEITPFGFLVPPAMFGSTVHPPTLTDWDGHLTARFGVEHPQSEASYMMGAVFAPDSTAVWSARGTAYELDLVSRDGRILKHIQRDVPWFPAHTGPTTLPWIERPKPRIHSIYVDDDGRLWLLIRRASRTWEPRTLGPRRTDRPISPTNLPGAVEANRSFEGVIEVLDPTTGRLIASRDVDGNVVELTSTGMACEFVEDADGLISIRLSRLVLRESGS